MYEPSPSWFPIVAHKVGLRLYNLSAGLSYVSIKDQVVRACALIDSLDKAGALKSTAADTSAFDVIVIGAGAAGVTAGWRAASLGMRVCIVEKSDAPFSAQRNCHDRFVSFSMYDWPESFAATGVFPSLSGLPFPGKGGDKDRFPCFSDSAHPMPASALANKWTSRLGLSGTAPCSSSPPLPIHWLFKRRATYQVPPNSSIATPPSTLEIAVTDVDSSETSVLSAANLIVATGIGLERPVGAYNPAPFWQNNPQAPWHHKPKSKSKPSKRLIVISGAGDGAIQDAMKSLWKSEPIDLIPVVESLLGRTNAMSRNQAILAAERHAERQLLWGVDDIETYRSLQAIYEGLANQIPATRVDRWRAKHFREDMHVHWIVGTAGVFTKTYPLNRMLASVLKRPEFTDHVTFHHGCLKSVKPVGSAWECEILGKATIVSHFPPIARHGVETQDVDVDSFDRDTLRVALSRAPVPFKPYDF